MTAGRSQLIASSTRGFITPRDGTPPVINPCRGHSYDGCLPGCTGASRDARAVLQRRVPGVAAGRAAHQNQDRKLRTGRSGTRIATHAFGRVTYKRLG